MKTLARFGILAAVSMAALLFFAPAAEAQEAAGEPAVDTKLAVGISFGNHTTLLSRVGGPAVKAQAPPFPSFDEVPHAAPEWATDYSHSYYDENGRLWDVYTFPGMTIAAPTSYYLDQ